MKKDSYLLRWLRHQQLDLNRAATSIKSAHQWRQDNKIDSILDEDFSAFEKMFPHEIDSVDKEGRPVWIQYFGRWDVRKIALSGQITAYNRFLDYQFEKIDNKTRELNDKNPDKNIGKYILLLDMSGYNLRQQGCLACIPGTTHFVSTYERYYAGSCLKAFLVNTPTVFESLYEIIQPLMSAETKKVLAIYGHNQADWQNILNQYISPQNLPKKFGGTKPSKKTN